jgi:hypothetical protein
VRRHDGVDGELTPPLLGLEWRVTKLQRKLTVCTHPFSPSLFGMNGARSRSSYSPACFHVRRGQIGLENLSQLSWGFVKCVYAGNSI